MSGHDRAPFEDPLSWIPRLARKLYSLWVTWTYPFASLGSNLSVHHACELQRSVADLIRIGNSVVIEREAWINIPVRPSVNGPAIILEDGCRIGRRCSISAIKRIHIEKYVLFAPSVLVMDHNHAYGDVTSPVVNQGSSEGGTIRIEEGCWIGFGAAIVCGHGELTIGRNSVIGANSVVTRSIPPYSVVVGNPAKVVKQFDPVTRQWVKVSRDLVEKG
jgi:acetyltransferase-like isoleucine patch superfamily enzyme